MKFALISDLHLLTKNPIARTDDLPKTQFDKLRFIFQFAKDNGATILQGGDFFDAARSWVLLPEAIDVIRYYGVDIYGVYGQHDTYMYNENTRHRTSLGVLEKVGLIHSLSDSPTEFENGTIMIYGANFGQKLPVVERQNGVFNIGVIHAPIAEAPIYPGHKFWDAKQFLKRNDGYNLILCADIHRSFFYYIGDRIIVNTGPIIRKEASEYNFKHEPHIYLLDTDCPDEIEKIMVPVEPGVDVLDRSHIENANEKENMMDSFIESIKDEDSALFGISFEQILLNYYEHNNIEPAIRNIIAETMEEKG